MEDSCEHGNEPSGYIKRWEAAQLAASQEGLSSIKLVWNLSPYRLIKYGQYKFATECEMKYLIKVKLFLACGVPANPKQWLPIYKRDADGV
jgi:hypothetical protein